MALPAPCLTWLIYYEWGDVHPFWDGRFNPPVVTLQSSFPSAMAASNIREADCSVSLA